MGIIKANDVTTSAKRLASYSGHHTNSWCILRRIMPLLNMSQYQVAHLCVHCIQCFWNIKLDLMQRLGVLFIKDLLTLDCRRVSHSLEIRVLEPHKIMVKRLGRSIHFYLKANISEILFLFQSVVSYWLKNLVIFFRVGVFEKFF